MPISESQIERICDAVAAQTACEAATVRKRRRGGMSKATRLAIFVCSRMEGLQPREIGAAFGVGRVDALRAIQRSTWQIKEDAEFSALVEAVTIAATLGQSESPK